MALKRARSPSLTAPPDEEDSTPIRASKFQRTEDEPVPDIIWCKLPPTCSLPHSATACRGVAELEAHYAHFHAFVCQAEGCSCVFDREHYLNLHQTELHNPLALLRKERGEHIRKRHLISAHQFEETFFFAVTKYGIGDQIRAWGLGEQRSLTSKEPPTNADGRNSQQEATASKARKSQNRRSAPPSSSTTVAGDPVIDDLASKLEKVTMVPSAIRFGRGGTKGGFQRPSHKARAQSLSDITAMRLDTSQGSGSDEGGLDEAKGPLGQSVGVRFSDDVAIRFMSPVDPRFRGNDARKRGRRRGGPARSRNRDDNLIATQDIQITNGTRNNSSLKGRPSRGRGRGRVAE